MNLRRLTQCLAVVAIMVPALPHGIAFAAPPRPALRANPQIIALPLKLVVGPVQRLCNARSASGLGYRVLRAGTGAKAAGDANVTVNYIGYLATTGEVFDQGQDVSFAMQRLIPGFTEGLGMMQVGSLYRFCIPAGLGYGDKETGPIPANSALVFQVELMKLEVAAKLR